VTNNINKYNAVDNLYY